jgi:P2 family phage contractile tail tube protein
MIPQVLTNCNLFVDGKSYAGNVTSITLPKLTRKADDHRAGGMDGPVSVGMGMEMLEASFSLSCTSPDVLKFFGLADDTAFNGAFRGSFKEQTGAVVAVIATLRGQLSENDAGEWKPGEKAESKFTVKASYYKLEIDGQAIYELDPANCIRIINGTDEAAAERAAIGL